MSPRKKKEADQRAKWFLLMTWARIVAEITIIIGFFIFVYLLISKYL